MRLFLVLAAVLIAAPARSQQTGSLKARFVYGGQAFQPETIAVDKDIAFCGRQPVVNEKLLINAENRGIKNVVLYVYTGRGGSTLPAQPASNQTHSLANDKCRFEPRVVFVQAGDSLKLSNLDAVGHNFNMSFFANSAQNLTIPPGGEHVIKIDKAEPAVIPVECNIHPWMRGYVVALDHSFAGISAEDGTLEIKGLPAGEELAFRLFHEAAAGAIREVSIDGDTTQLRRSLLELMIEPGENDFGTITIPAAALKP